MASGGKNGAGGPTGGVTGAGSSMTTELPDGLQKFFKVTLGMTWPEGSEGGLRAMEGAWREFQDDLENRAEEIGTLIPRLQRAMRGDTARAMVTYLEEVKKNLEDAAASAGEFAKMCKTTAADIQKGKIMLIAMAAMVLAMVIQLIASLFGAFAVPGVLAMGRTLLQAIWRAIVQKISQATFQGVVRGAAQLAWTMGKYAAGGAAFMGGLDLGIQLGQVGGGTRDEIDWNSVKNMAIGGAIGGAAFGAFHGFAKGLAGITNGVLKKPPPGFVKAGGGPKAPPKVGAPGGGPKAPPKVEGHGGAGKQPPKVEETPGGAQKPPGAKELPDEVPGWVRGFGQFGYAGGQVGMVVVSNPAVNKAVGHDDDIWAGMLGGAGHFHGGGKGGAIDKAGEWVGKKLGGAFGMNFDGPAAINPDEVPLLGEKGDSGDDSGSDSGSGSGSGFDGDSISEKSQSGNGSGWDSDGSSVFDEPLAVQDGPLETTGGYTNNHGQQFGEFGTMFDGEHSITTTSDGQTGTNNGANNSATNGSGHQGNSFAEAPPQVSNDAGDFLNGSQGNQANQQNGAGGQHNAPTGGWSGGQGGQFGDQGGQQFSGQGGQQGGQGGQQSGGQGGQQGGQFGGQGGQQFGGQGGQGGQFGGQGGQGEFGGQGGQHGGFGQGGQQSGFNGDGQQTGPMVGQQPGGGVIQPGAQGGQQLGGTGGTPQSGPAASQPGGQPTNQPVNQPSNQPVTQAGGPSANQSGGPAANQSGGQPSTQAGGPAANQPGGQSTNQPVTQQSGPQSSTQQPNSQQPNSQQANTQQSNSQQPNTTGGPRQSAPVTSQSGPLTGPQPSATTSSGGTTQLGSSHGDGAGRGPSILDEPIPKIDIPALADPAPQGGKPSLSIDTSFVDSRSNDPVSPLTDEERSWSPGEVSPVSPITPPPAAALPANPGPGTPAPHNSPGTPAPHNTPNTSHTTHQPAPSATDRGPADPMPPRTESSSAVPHADKAIRDRLDALLDKPTDRTFADRTADKPSTQSTDRPTQSTDRPAQSADRPAQPTDRPAQSSDRPAQSSSDRGGQSPSDRSGQSSSDRSQQSSDRSGQSGPDRSSQSSANRQPQTSTDRPAPAPSDRPAPPDKQAAPEKVAAPGPDRSTSDRPGAKAPKQEEVAAAVVAVAHLGPDHHANPSNTGHQGPGHRDGFAHRDSRQQREAWDGQRSAAKPTRVSMERFLPTPNPKDRTVENSQVSGTISQIRYDVRHFEVEPGKWALEFSVPLDLVSPNNKIDADTRAKAAEELQRQLDAHFNFRQKWQEKGQFEGSQIHFTVDARTPNGFKPGWDADPTRNVPVDVHRGNPFRKVNQVQWDLAKPVDTRLHEFFHFLGLDDSGVGPNPGVGRDGIMGMTEKKLTPDQLGVITALFDKWSRPVISHPWADPSTHTQPAPDPTPSGELVNSVFSDGPYSGQHAPPNAPNPRDPQGGPPRDPQGPPRDPSPGPGPSSRPGRSPEGSRGDRPSQQDGSRRSGQNRPGGQQPRGLFDDVNLSPEQRAAQAEFNAAIEANKASSGEGRSLQELFSPDKMTPEQRAAAQQFDKLFSGEGSKSEGGQQPRGLFDDVNLSPEQRAAAQQFDRLFSGEGNKSEGQQRPELEIRQVPESVDSGGKDGYSAPPSTPSRGVPPDPAWTPLAVTVDRAQAEALYNEFTTSTFRHSRRGDVALPTEHPEDGCYFRAHEWAETMLNRGIDVRKVFVGRQSPSLKTMSSNAFGATSNNPRPIHWGYHVAPMIAIDPGNGGRPEYMVLDPAMGRGLVDVRTWLDLAGVKDGFKEADLTNPKPYHHPHNASPLKPGEPRVLVTDPYALVPPWLTVKDNASTGVPEVHGPASREDARRQAQSRAMEDRIARYSDEAGKRREFRTWVESLSERQRAWFELANNSLQGNKLTQFQDWFRGLSGRERAEFRTKLGEFPRDTMNRVPKLRTEVQEARDFLAGLPENQRNEVKGAANFIVLADHYRESGSDLRAPLFDDIVDMVAHKYHADSVAKAEELSADLVKKFGSEDFWRGHGGDPVGKALDEVRGGAGHGTTPGRAAPPSAAASRYTPPAGPSTHAPGPDAGRGGSLGARMRGLTFGSAFTGLLDLVTGSRRGDGGHDLEGGRSSEFPDPPAAPPRNGETGPVSNTPPAPRRTTAPAPEHSFDITPGSTRLGDAQRGELDALANVLTNAAATRHQDGYLPPPVTVSGANANLVADGLAEHGINAKVEPGRPDGADVVVDWQLKREARDPAEAILGDESWRHSTAERAPWFDPKADHVPPKVVEDAARNAPVSGRVQGEEGGLRRSGAPWRGPIAYDIRRFEVEKAGPDGRPVTVPVEHHTTKLFLDNKAKATSTELQALRDRAKAGVDELYNHGYRMANGRQYHRSVEFVDDPAEAHAVIKVDKRGERTNQLNWPVDATARELGHESGHFGGMHDEYLSTDADKPVFQHQAGRGHVMSDKGPMTAGYKHQDARLKPRNMWLMENRMKVLESGPDLRTPPGEYPAPPRTPGDGQSGQNRPGGQPRGLFDDVNLSPEQRAAQAEFNAAIEANKASSGDSHGRSTQELFSQDKMSPEQRAAQEEFNAAIEANKAASGEARRLQELFSQDRMTPEQRAAAQQFDKLFSGAGNKSEEQQRPALDTRQVPESVDSGGRDGYSAPPSTPSRGVPPGPAWTPLAATVDRAQAEALYNEFTASTFRHSRRGDVALPTEHPEDGCYFRAHEWAETLLNRGVDVRKVFVGRLSPSLKTMSSNAFGATASNPRPIHWGYHVAPMIAVDSGNGGRPEYMVLDPAMGRGLVDVRTWLDLAGVKDGFKEADLTDPKPYHHPHNASPLKAGEPRVLVTDPYALVPPWLSVNVDKSTGVREVHGPASREDARRQARSMEDRIARYSDEAGKRREFRTWVESLSERQRAWFELANNSLQGNKLAEFQNWFRGLSSRQRAEFRATLSEIPRDTLNRVPELRTQVREAREFLAGLPENRRNEVKGAANFIVLADHHREGGGDLRAPLFDDIADVVAHKYQAESVAKAEELSADLVKKFGSEEFWRSRGGDPVGKVLEEVRTTPGRAAPPSAAASRYVPPAGSSTHASGPVPDAGRGGSLAERMRGLTFGSAFTGLLDLMSGSRRGDGGHDLEGGFPDPPAAPPRNSGTGPATAADFPNPPNAPSPPPTRANTAPLETIHESHEMETLPPRTSGDAGQRGDGFWSEDQDHHDSRDSRDTDSTSAVPADTAPPVPPKAPALTGPIDGDAVRSGIPEYVLENRGAGKSDNPSAVTGVNPARTIGDAVPALRGHDKLRQIHHEVTTDYRPFVGENRKAPYRIVVGKDVYEVRPRVKQRWDLVEVVDPAAEAGAMKPGGDNKTASSNTKSTELDGSVTKQVNVSAMPPLLVNVRGGGTLTPSETHEISGQRKTNQSTEAEVKALHRVRVPVELSYEITNTKGELVGQVTDSAGVSRNPSETGKVEVDVPLNLGRRGDDPFVIDKPKTLPAAPRIEELFTNTKPRNGFFEQAAKLLPKSLTEVRSSGRGDLQSLLSDSGLKSKWHKMAVTEEDIRRNPDAGWQRSPSLVKGPDSTRWSNKASMFEIRAVAKRVEVIDTVPDVKATDSRLVKDTLTKKDSTARGAEGSLMVGVGGDVANTLYVGAGPAFGGSATSSHTMEHTAKDLYKTSVSKTGDEVRYRTEHVLQVRPLGGAVRTLDGDIVTYQSTSYDKAAAAGLVPPREDATPLDATEQRLPPPWMQAKKSLGGTVVDDFKGGDNIYRAVARSLRKLPGRKWYHMTRSDYVVEFGDVKVASYSRGLKASVERLLSRSDGLRKDISDEHLSELVDTMLTDRGVTFTVKPKDALPGEFGSTVTLKATLDEIKPAGRPDESTFTSEAGEKLSSKLSGERSGKGDIGVQPRFWHPVGNSGLSHAGNVNVGRSKLWSSSGDMSAKSSEGTKRTHGQGAATDGAAAPQKMWPFGAKLTITPTVTSIVHSSVGLPGRSAPTPITQTLSSHEVPLRVLVPDQLTSSKVREFETPAPTNKHTMDFVPKPNQLTRKAPRILDDVDVVAVFGTDHLGDALDDRVHAASGDPVDALGPDGRAKVPHSSRSGEDQLTPDALRRSRRRFEPISVDRDWKRGWDTLEVDSTVLLTPSNPRPVRRHEFQEIEKTYGTGSGVGRTDKTSSSFGITAGDVVLPVSNALGSDPVVRFRGIVGGEATPFELRWGQGKASDFSSSSETTVKSARLVKETLVWTDYTADVVTDAKYTNNYDKAKLFPGKEPGRAGVSYDQPKGMLMWATDEQIAAMKAISDAKADNRSDASTDSASETRSDPGSEGRSDGGRSEGGRTSRSNSSPHAGISRTATEDSFATMSVGQMSRQESFASNLSEDAAPSLPAPASVVGGKGVSLGVGAITTTVDVRDRMRHLHARLAKTLGDHGADALLPKSRHDAKHDNHGMVDHVLANVNRAASAALNGGQIAPLRRELGRWQGRTYYLSVGARFVDGPAFTGIEHVDKLAVSDSVSRSDSGSKSSGHTVGKVGALARPGIIMTGKADPAAANNTTGHGPASGNLATGLGADAALGRRDDETTRSVSQSHKQSAETSGPMAAYSGRIVLDLRIERGFGLDEHGKEVAHEVVAKDTVAPRDVTMLKLPEESFPEPTGGKLGAAGPEPWSDSNPPPDKVTAEQTGQWRDQPGHMALTEQDAPRPDRASYERGTFIAEHYFGDMTEFRNRAEQALMRVPGVKELPSRTIAELRSEVTLAAVKAGAPDMMAGKFTFPLSDFDLEVHLGLGDEPRLSGAGDWVDIEAKSDTTYTDKSSSKTGHDANISGLPVQGGGGVTHPGGKNSFAEGRNNFGSVFSGSQANNVKLGGHESVLEREGSEKGKAGTPKSNEDHGKITQVDLHDAQFLFVARKKGAADDAGAGVATMPVSDAFAIRHHQDPAKPLPESLTKAVTEHGEARKAWTAAVKELDALRLRQHGNGKATGHGELGAAETKRDQAAAKYWATKQEYDTQLVAARAAQPVSDAAHAAAQAEARTTRETARATKAAEDAARAEEFAKAAERNGQPAVARSARDEKAAQERVQRESTNAAHAGPVMARDSATAARRQVRPSIMDARRGAQRHVENFPALNQDGNRFVLDAMRAGSRIGNDFANRAQEAANRAEETIRSFGRDRGDSTPDPGSRQEDGHSAVPSGSSRGGEVPEMSGARDPDTTGSQHSATSRPHEAGGPVEVPAGLALLDPSDTANNEAARNYPTRPGEYVVFAHGTPTGPVKGGEPISAANLADMIRRDPRSHGKRIVLVSCFTGADPATGTSFAEQLARELPGTSVLAPTATAWVTPSGRTFAGGITIGADGRPRPDLSQGGQWREFVSTDPATATGSKDLGQQLSPAPDTRTTDHPARSTDEDLNGAVPFMASINTIDATVKTFTDTYGGGNLGRATHTMLERFARSKAHERDKQTLSHLSFALFDAINYLRDRRDDSSVPKDHEVQGMLINNRLVFTSNFDASFGLVRDYLRRHSTPEHAMSFRELLRRGQDDARMTVGRPGIEGANYIYRMSQAHNKVEEAFDGLRDNATSRALLTDSTRYGQRIVFADANVAPDDHQGRQSLARALTHDDYAGSVILLTHSGTGGKSMHAEQKSIAAVYNAGLRPRDVSGPHVVMGRLRPCFCCWGVLRFHRQNGFDVTFNNKYGRYNLESLKTAVRHLPAGISDFLYSILASQSKGRMSTAAPAQQVIPADALATRERVVPTNEASRGGEVSASDSETEITQKHGKRVYRHKPREFFITAKSVTLGKGEKEKKGRATYRALSGSDEERLEHAASRRDQGPEEFADFVDMLKDLHIRKKANYTELGEKSGISAGHASRLINDKTGHEGRRKGDDKDYKLKRVVTRGGDRKKSKGKKKDPAPPEQTWPPADEMDVDADGYAAEDESMADNPWADDGAGPERWQTYDPAEWEAPRSTGGPTAGPSNYGSGGYTGRGGYSVSYTGGHSASHTGGHSASHQQLPPGIEQARDLVTGERTFYDPSTTTWYRYDPRTGQSRYKDPRTGQWYPYYR